MSQSDHASDFSNDEKALPTKKFNDRVLIDSTLRNIPFIGNIFTSEKLKDQTGQRNNVHPNNTKNTENSAYHTSNDKESYGWFVDMDD